MSDVKPMDDAELAEADFCMSDDRYDHSPISVDIYKRLRARLDVAEAASVQAAPSARLAAEKIVCLLRPELNGDLYMKVSGVVCGIIAAAAQHQAK